MLYIVLGPVCLCVKILSHIGATYSVIEYHMSSVVVLVFVLHFELISLKGCCGSQPSSWYSVCAVCNSASCRKSHLRIWVEPCSLDQLNSMTLSIIYLPLCAVDETL